MKEVRSADAMTGRTFAYCRVSTIEQDTDTQIQMIRAAGYDVRDSRVHSEHVSGSVPAVQREGFRRLLDKLEEGDRLVVLKLDRLGRDTVDVLKTVAGLEKSGIKVVSLDLPIPDLSSNEGKLMLTMLAAVAEFERNRIRERTAEAIAARRAEGKPVGRPVATKTTQAVLECREVGLSQSQTAEKLGCSIRTVKGHWNKQLM